MSQKQLEDLSLRELLGLCGYAHQKCIARFERIGKNADPADRSLQELLGEMARRAEGQCESVEEYEGRLPDPGGPEVSPDDADHLIRRCFPSHTKGFGEGLVHRDVALFYAESTEEEAARFYRTLAEIAPDWEARTFFQEMSEREASKLRHLREVVLQG